MTWTAEHTRHYRYAYSSYLAAASAVSDVLASLTPYEPIGPVQVTVEEDPAAEWLLTVTAAVKHGEAQHGEPPTPDTPRRDHFGGMAKTLQRIADAARSRDHLQSANTLERSAVYLQGLDSREVDRFAVGPLSHLETEELADILLLVNVHLPQDIIDAWGKTVRSKVAEWAVATHLKASDNHDVIVPPVPRVLHGLGLGETEQEFEANQ